MSHLTSLNISVQPQFYDPNHILKYNIIKSFYISRIMAPKIKLVKRQAEKIEETLSSTIGTIVEQRKVHHTSTTTEASDEGI